eukprot:8853230-Alexandrium_andersonii.AAC.1
MQRAGAARLVRARSSALKPLGGWARDAPLSDDPPQACGCAQGSYLDLAAAACQRCPLGRWAAR